MLYIIVFESRGSSVGVVTGYGLDGRGVGVRVLLSTLCRPVLGPTQPHIQWIPGVKRPGCEADHSPPTTAEVRNGGAIPPLPHVLVAWGELYHYFNGVSSGSNCRLKND
jgi:hypothetical protein